MKKYLDKFKLNKKISYIVGGSGLIGYEISKLFSSLGSKVIVLDIKKNNINNLKCKYEYFDCTDFKNIEKNLNIIIKKHKVPDIFVNCSYPSTNNWYNSTFDINSLEITRINVDFHLSSYIWMSSYFANKMKKNKIKGSIILLGSIYGMLGQNLNIYKGTSMKENNNYTAIKGGIINHSKQLASYYGKFGIRSNAISPGGVKGHIVGSNQKQSSKFLKNYSNQTPLGRLANSEEIALAALFLASNASNYITGTNLVVDGGWSSI